MLMLLYPKARTQYVMIDGAGGRIQTGSNRQLIDVDRARNVPDEVADIPDVEDHAARQLLLNAEIVRDRSAFSRCVASRVQALLPDPSCLKLNSVEHQAGGRVLIA